MSDSDAGSAKPETLRTRWAIYREVCFAKYSGCNAWIWAAAAPCELYLISLSVMNTPGFALSLECQSVCIAAFGERHLIPLAQMTPQSMAALQMLVCECQAHATEAQRKHAHDRFGIDGPPMVLAGLVH